MDLIVTAGCVILDIHPVKIVSAYGKIPAEIVAYDHDTGFSLSRSASPPGVKPLKLGNSQHLAPKQPLLVVAHGGTANAIGALE